MLNYAMLLSKTCQKFDPRIRMGLSQVIKDLRFGCRREPLNGNGEQLMFP